MTIFGTGVGGDVAGDLHAVGGLVHIGGGLHVHLADRWRRDQDPLAAFYLSQGVPALFWGGQVLRDGAWVPMRGTTPTEFDIVVPDGR